MEDSLSTARRWARAVDVSFGVLLGVLSGLSLVLWVFPGDDPHGGGFALMGALVLAPVAASLLLAARLLRLRRPLAWLSQLLPGVVVAIELAIVGVPL